MPWLWKHMNIKSCCVVLHIREFPQECGNVYAGILKIQIMYTTKVCHLQWETSPCKKKKKKKEGRHWVFRNLRAYRKMITLLICSCCVQRAPQGKWFPKDATWDVKKSQKSHSPLQNFLVSSMFIPGTSGGLHLKLTTVFVFFFLLQFSESSSSTWVSFTLFLFLGSFSLWGSLLSHHLGLWWSTYTFGFFLSSLCCCVSLCFLPYNLWTLIWSQRTQKDHSVLMVCFELLCFILLCFVLRKGNDWHTEVH